MAPRSRRCEGLGVEPRDRFSVRRWLGATLAAVLLTALVACGTAPATDPDLGSDPGTAPGQFDTSAWNEATWQ